MIFTYHEVVRQDNPYIYSITCEQLARHAKFLRTAGDPASCSFDDGHISQYELAFPVLSEHKCGATFFVTAGWIGAKAGYMSWEQLRELSSLGFNIQSHSWSHKYLNTCSESALSTELLLSKVTLEDKLGKAVQWISAPGGRWSAKVAAACAGAGYTHLYISNAWHRASVNGVAVVGRYMVRRTTREGDLERLSRSEHRCISGPRVRQEVTNGVRRMLGDRLYHRLWSCIGSAPASSRNESM
jgi:peptidoglycan/xylan/chitin deacetylase (PgdA/CDA1 family)